VSEQNTIEWATIGKVVALFGIRGELKVRLLTDIPNRFADLDAICPSPDHKRYAIESVRPYKGEMIILKLEGVDDASAAEPLRNCDLDIPVSALTKLPPDSYYEHDVLGLHSVPSAVGQTPRTSSLPPGEAAILWLRKHHPEKADDIVARAQHYYQASA